MRLAFPIVVALSLAAGACGGGSETLPADALVLVVSSDLSVGPHRLAVAAFDADNVSLVTDDPVSFEFFRPDGTPAGATSTRFIWAIPDVRGMWVTNFQFDVPGAWTLGVRTSDGRLVPSAPFSVNADSLSIGIGDAAPASMTKTIRDGSLAEISTDHDPDPRFYDLTVAEAVASGRPSVIMFATPAFCTSATCGPTLDVAKAIIDDFADVAWVHVEVFDILADGSVGDTVPAIFEWRLQTEPWVFVVDAGGVVRSRFEGALDEAELRDALGGVAG